MSHPNSQSLVTWNYSLSDNTGYLLQISRDSGSTFFNSIIFPLESSSYYDNDVTWGDSRWYRVYATNDYGSSLVSDLAYVYIYGPYIPPPSESPSLTITQTTGSSSPTFALMVGYNTIYYNNIISDALVGNWGINNLNTIIYTSNFGNVNIMSASISGSGFAISGSTIPLLPATSSSVRVNVWKTVSGPQSASLILTFDKSDSPITIYLQGA